VLAFLFKLLGQVSTKIALKPTSSWKIKLKTLVGIIIIIIMVIMLIIIRIIAIIVTTGVIVILL
jgi:hypothetical protein